MTARLSPHEVDHPTSDVESLLADRGGFFSNNPLWVEGDIAELRVQLLAAVLLEVSDGARSRWALIEDGIESPMSGRWRFPGNVFSPGQMPLQVALGAITDNIVLLDSGLPVSWAGLVPSVLSVGLDWLPARQSDLAEACQAEWANTLVFTYHARMVVPDVARMELCDVTARQGQRIWLAGIVDIETCVANGTVCAASEQMWASYWAAAD
jgi:hypothetical protein